MAQPTQRPKSLSSSHIKNEYPQVTQYGDSNVPADAEEVDFRYTCFIESESHLFEVDSDLSGPIDFGVLKDDENVFSEPALGLIRRFMKANGGGNIHWLQSVGISTER